MVSFFGPLLKEYTIKLVAKISRACKSRRRMRQQINQAKTTVETLWRDRIPIETFTRPVPTAYTNQDQDETDNLSLSPMLITEHNAPGCVHTQL